MTKEELKQEAEEYTKNLLKKLGIKEDMLLENQPKYLRQESMNFVALDVENVTDAYLASAEPREKQIAELEKENAVLERRIERAKECMKKLLFIINSDPANYNCKGLVQDAENFIYNRTCNIRQQGKHCITEERCIMCDK